MSDEPEAKPAYSYGGGKSLPRVPPLVAKAVRDMLMTEHRMIRPPVYAAPLLALIVKLYKEGRPFPLRDDVADILDCSVHTVDAALSTRIDQGYIKPRVETRPGAVGRRDSTIRVLYYDPSPELVHEVEQGERDQREADEVKTKWHSLRVSRGMLQGKRRALYQERFKPAGERRPTAEIDADIKFIERRLAGVEQEIEKADIWYRQYSDLVTVAKDGAVYVVEPKTQQAQPDLTTLAPPAPGCDAPEDDRADHEHQSSELNPAGSDPEPPEVEFESVDYDGDVEPLTLKYG